MSFMAIYVIAQNAINPASYDLSNVLYLLYIIILYIYIYIYDILSHPPPCLPIPNPPIYRGGKINAINAKIPMVTGDINDIDCNAINNAINIKYDA